MRFAAKSMPPNGISIHLREPTPRANPAQYRFIA